MLIGPLPLSELQPHRDVSGLAIGVFDGVHLGHQEVVKSLSGHVAALTFEPHPLAVIAPDRVPPRLTSLAQRTAYLRALGTVVVVAVKFDQALRALGAEAFVEELARIFPGLKQIAIGEGWSFGRDREGNAARLAELASAHGFEVRSIPPVLLDEQPVSSTRIREAIAQRRFADAARLLGRPYAVSGVVIAGEARGRQIGFRTANLGGVEQMLPPRGVYAVLVRVGDQSFPSVMNLGQRPTFTSNGADSLEVHLLEGGRDLYGEELELSDFTWIREEQKFDHVEALKAQIARDAEQARALLPQA